MREMLEEKLARFTELEGMMMDPEVLGNSSKLAAVAREHGGLAKLAGLYRNFKNVVAELGELKEMARHEPAFVRIAVFCISRARRAHFSQKRGFRVMCSTPATIWSRRNTMFRHSLLSVISLSAGGSGAVSRGNKIPYKCTTYAHF